MFCIDRIEICKIFYLGSNPDPHSMNTDPQRCLVPLTVDQLLLEDEGLLEQGILDQRLGDVQHQLAEIVRLRLHAQAYIFAAEIISFFPRIFPSKKKLIPFWISIV